MILGHVHEPTKKRRRSKNGNEETFEAGVYSCCARPSSVHVSRERDNSCAKMWTTVDICSGHELWFM